MSDKTKRKILLLEDLVKKVEAFKKAGKTVVQTHGVFDIIHPGIIRHLHSAREQGDVLVVTVIKDKDVRRGPGRPVFPETLRAENVASLSRVDYVCVVDDEIPFDCVRRIKPDVFAKGQSHKERDQDITQKISKEERGIYFGKCRIYETDGFSLTSSEVLKNFLTIYPDEVRSFLRHFSKKYSFSDIAHQIHSLQKLKILLIGDGIIDEYHYCDAMGRAAKAPLVVNRYLNHEVFAGGAFAIANHIASFCDTIQLVSLLGADNSREDFLQNEVNPVVQKQFFFRDDGPTIVKKRYINPYLNQKLFEVNYLNDNFINGQLETEVTAYLESQIPDYDIVLVSDFGHGFITKKIINLVQKKAKRFAVNTQTNAANAGYNMITKYSGPSYVCLDEPEVRLSAQDRRSDIEAVAKNMAHTIKSEYFIVTRGRFGSLGIDKKNNIVRTPIFSTKVVDTVGAGDAFFAYTAPCIAKGVPFDLVCFIGNVVGALAVQIMGNKKPVLKYEVLEFIHALMR